MIKASVCLSTRNKAPYLDRTLESIRAQKVPFAYEIVVADDGSTDDTWKVCEKHGAIRVWLQNPRYRNPAKARNAAYRVARGDIIIPQSDDVMHVSPDTIASLVEQLRPGEAVIPTVLNMQQSGSGDWTPCYTPFHVYGGPQRQKPLFFLGAIWRSDVFAMGGNDEEFTEPCWEDDWFAAVLTRGLGVNVRYLDHPVAWHQAHPHPHHAHDNIDASRLLFDKKRRVGRQTGQYVNSTGSWMLREEKGDIPKRMTFFWGGPKLSWMRYMTLKSFRHFNPDWEMRLYRPHANNQDATRWASGEKEDGTTPREDYTDRLKELDLRVIEMPPTIARSITHASDLLEWQLLSTEGGFFSDMDILYVAPMSTIYDRVRSLDALFCLSMGYMVIGFFGATPGCPLFDAVLQEAKRHYEPTRYQSTGAEALYSLAGLRNSWPRVDHPGCITLAGLRERFPDLAIGEIPARSIYPWNFMHVGSIFEEHHPVPEGCIGVHWFGGNPLAQDWNRRLTEANFREPDNTFCNAAKLTYA